MLTLSPSARIFACLRPADMRKSIDGLAAMAVAEAGEEPLDGHLFLFRNRRGDRLKALYWDRNGYAVWYKRLEKGRFSFPPEGSGRVTVSSREMQLLAGGLCLEGVWKTRGKTQGITEEKSGENELYPCAGKEP